MQTWVMFTNAHPSSENGVHIIQTNWTLMSIKPVRAAKVPPYGWHSVAGLSIEQTCRKALALTYFCLHVLWELQYGVHSGPGIWVVLQVGENFLCKPLLKKRKALLMHCTCLANTKPRPDVFKASELSRILQINTYLRSHVIVHGVDDIVQKVDV